MSREALARASDVSVRTIAKFEAPAESHVNPPNVQALRTALEQAGARFTDFGIITE